MENNKSMKFIKILLLLQFIFILMVGFRLMIYPSLERNYFCEVNPNIGPSYCYNAKVNTSVGENIVKFNFKHLPKILIAHFLLSLIGFIFTIIYRKRNYSYKRLLFWISSLYIISYLLTLILLSQPGIR